MAKPFDECWQRIERAKTHSAAAAQAWNSFIEDEQPYEVDVDVDPGGDGAIWIEQVAPIPSAVAFELSEFLYQMRAALDHCIYEAACLKSGVRPPPNEDKLEFFLRDTPEKFEMAAWKIAPLGPAQHRILELFQPYNAPPTWRQTSFPTTTPVDCRFSTIGHASSLSKSQDSRRTVRPARTLVGGFASTFDPKLFE